MARVLVIGSYAESLINFRGQLLQEMVRLGHDVLACAPDASPVLEEKLLSLGAAYQKIYLQRTGINPIQDFKTLLSLNKVIRSFEPDVFFGYTVKPVLYGSIIARYRKVPGLYSMITGLGYAFIGSGYKQMILGKMVREMYRVALRGNSKIFFQNPDDRKLFIDKGILTGTEKTCLVNGSGVDLDYFAPVPYPENLSFLLIARLLPEKGIYEYVEAARKLKRKYPSVRFCLVGWRDSGPSSISPEELRSWQDEGLIEYLGRLDDVRPALGDASVYVLPSYREGTPRTVLEAMAMGRAVITSDAPGCRETVENGENGILVPVRNADSLASAMEEFVLFPELVERMGKKSRILAQIKYDVHMVNRVMLQEMELLPGK